MVSIDVLTIFPGYFKGPLSESLIQKAIEKQHVSIHIHDIRNYATDTHKTVDDSPFGGGPGMVMRIEPTAQAITALQKERPHDRVILLSPAGEKWNHQKAKEFSKASSLLLLCGRYEGVDARIQKWVTNEISIGDYVLLGGEAAALVLIESILRFIPGVVGDPQSVEEESFANGLLEYPQFTRPEVYEGEAVPPVLLSGNHEEIRKWRRKEALKATLQKRPDLWVHVKLSEEDRLFLQEILVK